MYPNALMPNPNNCAQFYDCRQMNTMFGNYLREVGHLTLISTYICGYLISFYTPPHTSHATIFKYLHLENGFRHQFGFF